MYSKIIMEFLNEVFEEECREIKKLYPPIPRIVDNWKCYRVKVTEDDFLHKIHIIVQGTPQNRIGWERFSPESCLGHYSQQVYNSNYLIPKELFAVYPQLQTKNFDIIKERAENFSREKMLLDPLLYLANKKTGPYMLRESVRRHIVAYIHYFILRKEKFESINNNAYCIISNEEQFYETKIPKNFC